MFENFKKNMANEEFLVKDLYVAYLGLVSVNRRRKDTISFNQDNLKVLNIGKNVEKIGSAAFAGLSITTVNYYATNSAGSSAFGSNSDHGTTYDVTSIGTLNIADNPSLPP